MERFLKRNDCRKNLPQSSKLLLEDYKTDKFLKILFINLFSLTGNWIKREKQASSFGRISKPRRINLQS